MYNKNENNNENNWQRAEELPRRTKMYVANTTGGLMLQTMLYLANHTSRAAVNTLIDMPPAPKSGKCSDQIDQTGLSISSDTAIA